MDLWKWGPGSVSSNRLEKPEIEPGNPVYKVIGLSTTPWQLLFIVYTLIDKVDPGSALFAKIGTIFWDRFLISQSKHMLCVLKRTVSMRQFF